jgi:hypothetical protein
MTSKSQRDASGKGGFWVNQEPRLSGTCFIYTIYVILSYQPQKVSNSHKLKSVENEEQKVQLTDRITNNSSRKLRSLIETKVQLVWAQSNQLQ